MTKRFKNLLGAIIFGGLLIAVTIKFLNKDININLSKTNQITGQVTNVGVTEKTSIVGGRVKMKGKAFFIILDNSRETFATYRPKQDYTKLSESIKIGDTVTINYNYSSSSEINLDVYQITKKGQVLQDYDSYNSNYKTIAWLTGIGGLGILTVGLYPFFKRRNRKHKAANIGFVQ